MKVIAFRQDHGVRDASDPAELGPVLDKLDLTGESKVTLDLKGCLFDYPGSSAIIDKVVQSWALIPGEKQLTVLLDYHLKKPTILSWLFLGSKHIKASSLKDIPFAQFEEQIKQCMKSVEASLTIRIEPMDGPISEFRYDRENS